MRESVCERVYERSVWEECMRGVYERSVWEECMRGVYERECMRGVYGRECMRESVCERVHIVPIVNESPPIHSLTYRE
jgi:hypothetical protein